MTSSARLLLFVLVAIVGVKLSEQLYGLVAHREERALAAELRQRLLDSGADLVVLRARTDSLKAEIERADGELEREQATIHRYHREARRGALDQADYARYGAQVSRYNLHVVSRNATLRELEALHARQLGASARYNGLADSLHTLAVRMKQPYYQVPTPLEAADERRRAAP